MGASIPARKGSWSMRRRAVWVVRLLAVIALAMTAFASPAFADDHDDDDTEFGAYIYEGTVDDYGDRPVEDAGEVELLRDDDDDDDDDVREIWNRVGDDGPAPGPLYGEEDEDISLTIEELTSEPHVLVVHGGDNRDAPVIAIGTIEGDVDADGTLLIDLDEVDDSGFEGRALFAPDDDVDHDDDHDDHGDDDHDDHDDLTEVTIGGWKVPAAGV